MAEEKEIESSKEDEKVEIEKSEQKSEEEESKDDFEKDSEVVPTNKYNQAVRKQRELEIEKREMEKRLAELESDGGNEEKEDDSFFKEYEKEEEKPDPAKLIDEKLKPVMDTLKKREENDRKIARTAFFETHPEYLSDSEKWQGLLDEMDTSMNPNSNDDYYTQLEKTHRILSGESYNSEIEEKKKDLAGDAASSGDGAEKGSVKEEFTAEDRQHQKQFNVSDEGMRAYKEKIKSGNMQILS